MPTPKHMARPTLLCGECRNLDFADPKLVFAYKFWYLEAKAKDQACELCALLYGVATSTLLPTPATGLVRFDRDGSTVRIGRDGPRVLSIVASPSPVMPLETRPPRDIQFGLPVLPLASSTLPWSLMKHWLANCDGGHDCMKPWPHTPQRHLPARLLDLGEGPSAGQIRLRGTHSMDPAMRYVALSFLWGSGSAVHKAVQTRAANLEAFLHGIDMGSLPATFRDAVFVTRQLGIRYLWIYSLCIIQDDETDIAGETRNLEKIFSNAYCVVAASSALNVSDGFLQPPRARAAVRVVAADDEPPMSVCEIIDNFEHDVDASPLSRRAWAFMERCFSRRTIFFTSSQRYWQCGVATRCETLTRLLPRY